MSDDIDDTDDNIIRGEPIFGKPDEDKDRPNTPILFPKHVRNSTALPVVLKTREEALAWLNKSYACITIKGKYKVLHEKSNDEIEIMEIVDFTRSLADMEIQITSVDDGKTIKVKIVPITELWLKWADRRRYDNGFTFDPSRAEHYGEMYNLFKGYKIVPREGVVTIFLDYMKNIICSGDEDNYAYLVALIAQMFQEPGKKPGVAVALRGDEGVGKSFFIEKLGELMGNYYFKTSNPAYIFGDHNGQLKNKLLMHLEEPFTQDPKKKIV
jgi:putative DNA primase/helicase